MRLKAECGACKPLLLTPGRAGGTNRTIGHRRKSPMSNLSAAFQNIPLAARVAAAARFRRQLDVQLPMHLAKEGSARAWRGHNRRVLRRKLRHRPSALAVSRSNAGIAM